MSNGKLPPFLKVRSITLQGGGLTSQVGLKNPELISTHPTNELKLVTVGWVRLETEIDERGGH